MIYAIIIVLALAVILVILARRLPEAARSAGSQSSHPTANANHLRSHTEAEASHHHGSAPSSPVAVSKPKMSWQFPSISLTLPKFGGFKFGDGNKTSKSDPVRKPLDESPILGTSVGSAKLNREETTVGELVNGKTHADFWAETISQTKPIEEPSVKSIEKPTPRENSPFQFKSKPKVRDGFQEAEDLFAVKDYKKAERAYLKLATEQPKNAKIYSRLGIIYLEQKNFEDAREALQQAVRLEPNVASRHFNIALVYLNLNSYSKAISSMELALKYDPSNRKYRKMLDDILAGRT